MLGFVWNGLDLIFRIKGRCLTDGPRMVTGACLPSFAVLIIILQCSQCRCIGDLSSLSALVGLTSLDLTRCQKVSDLTPLSGLSRLQRWASNDHQLLLSVEVPRGPHITRQHQVLLRSSLFLHSVLFILSRSSLSVPPLSTNQFPPQFSPICFYHSQPELLILPQDQLSRSAERPSGPLLPGS